MVKKKKAEKYEIIGPIVAVIGVLASAAVFCCF
jgi:hypothetical protein